jgi:GTP:adenosylcobinamide-phosphate guanylyltransferase
MTAVDVSKVPSIVLAGGKSKPDMIVATGVENRALIQVSGKTMLSHVVDALRSAGSPGICVVGNVGDSPSYRRLDDSGGFVENLFAGCEEFRDSPFVLVSTSDIPFLTRESIVDLVERGSELNADIVYPVVPVAKCYERFPGIKRTAAKIRDGEFTGGNVILARPEFLLSHRDRITRAYAARKSPLRLAIMLGLGTVARFALSLTGWRNVIAIEHLESAVSRLLGGQARALISSYPEIATDIDKPEDLEAIKNLDAGGMRR